MPPKKAKKKHKTHHHHIIGVVKHTHVPKVAEVLAKQKLVEPADSGVLQVVGPLPIVEEDHVLVAVPKSGWAKFWAAITGGPTD